MWPALAKQGTSRQRHPTDLRFNTHQQCRLLWSVIINYTSILSICQGHSIGRSLLVNHSSVLHTMSVKTCLPFMQPHDNSITLFVWFVLSETSQVLLATPTLLCQSRSQMFIHQIFTKFERIWYPTKNNCTTYSPANFKINAYLVSGMKMNLYDVSWKCTFMDKNVSKHPDNQQNGAQNFQKSGNFLSENSHACNVYIPLHPGGIQHRFH